MNKTLKIILLVVIAVVIIVGLALLFGGLGGSSGITKIDYTEFLSMAGEGKIAKIEIKGNTSNIYVGTENKPKYFTINPSRTGVANDIKEINEKLIASGDTSLSPIRISFDDPNKGQIWIQLLPFLGSALLITILIIVFVRMNKSAGGATNFAKTHAKINENVKVRFDDVAGAEEEKGELKEIVEFLKAPKKFTDIGARIPKGVLLVGPPGTGKTLFAKAVAGEANVPFFSISGSDFVEMFVGVGASRVRDTFETAKKNMPCIVFIDEIDAVGRQRGAGLGGGNDEREQTLNQLLVQMDGFESNQSIVIMAATNRADVLDPALLRPGRFDRQIYVNPPDVKGREEIFKVHSRNKPLSPDVNFKVLARMTSGFTGADIENLLNEAAILAARENKTVISMQDINEGINKVIMGPQKKSRIVTETDKRITAYHEAGHAIIAHKLENCDAVQEVSIIPRGQAAGYTMTRPENDDSHVTKQKLLDTICMMLGGRVAEEIIIKDISTGASNDIQRSSGIARKMICEWGMSDELGPIYLGGDGEVFLGRDYQSHNVYSEDVAGKVDKEIRNTVEECHSRATAILKEHIKVLHNMARLLIERETIYTEEIDMLFDGKSVEEIIKFIESKYQSKQNKPNDIIISESDIKKEEQPEAKQEENAEVKVEESTQKAEETTEAKAEESTSKAEEKQD